jgi:AraC family transcriptional regulator of adaptative response/methylated-DNA-[protein]-cysteine methyltransferase
MSNQSKINALPDSDRLWAAVQSRDRALDGAFVYAVRSTGIYCRPTCPSRRPRQAQVRYFADTREAQAAGFRACLRCLPDESGTDAWIVQQACDYLDSYTVNNDFLPSLADLTEALDIDEARLRRLFRRETGLTPNQYARARRFERFKSLLRKGAKVSDAIYDAGYGSSSRVYEDASGQLGMTPASYRKGGAGAVIRYVVTPSALGGLLLAGTAQGVCSIKLGDDTATLEAELRQEFPAAEIRRVSLDDDPAETNNLHGWTASALAYLDGSSTDIDLPLDLRATLFQWRVWRLLQAIPTGETRTYQQMAADLDHPKASRAVGRACATNPVAPVIPCHRAVRKDGGLAGYRWGLERKEALLEMERRQAGR